MEIYMIRTSYFLGEKETSCQVDRFAFKSLTDADEQVAFLKDIDLEIGDEHKFGIRKEYEILKIKLIQKGSEGK